MKTENEYKRLVADLETKLGVVTPMLSFRAMTGRELASIDRIFLHCTATTEGKAYGAEKIHSGHLNQGWSGIGYNYVINADGSIEKGRPLDVKGSHCPEGQGNAKGIGIVYAGGIARNGKAKDTRTYEQTVSMVKLIRELSKVFGIEPEKIYGHNDFTSKACPCFNVKEWLMEAGVFAPQFVKTDSKDV